MRSHLRAEFEKAGATWKAELVRLVTRLPAPADQLARVSINVTPLLA